MDKDTNNTIENNKKTSNNRSSSSSPKRLNDKGYNSSYIKSNSNEKDISGINKYTRANTRYINNKINEITNEDNIDEYEDDINDSLSVTEMVSSNKNNNKSISGEVNFLDQSKNKYLLVGIFIGVIFLFLLLILTIVGGKNPISSIGGLDGNPALTELKTKIKEVKSSIRSKYGVSIDEKLILATLIAYQDSDKYSEDLDVSYMSSKIELLAKYQIITKTKCDYDSSTIRKIASNDKGVLFGKEEKNYKCDSSSEDETYELSTERGNYSDDNSGSVYFWNLIDGDFITDYYKDFVASGNKEDEKDKKKIHNIVEDIYDFYEIMPDDEASGGVCGVIYADCPGVTVTGYGTYDLETYVAGVLAAEPGATMVNDDLGKFNAIIIRSYTLAHTNNCKNPITSSSNDQNFTPSETYRKYAEDTAGIVMADSDGQIIEAVYSLATRSDCIATNGKCKFQRCTKYAESISSCTGEVTEFLVPYDTITYSEHDIHYGGSEPYIAKYLSVEENYDYEMLLKAFYGKDITLSRLSGSTNSNISACGSGEYVSSDGITFESKNYDIEGTANGLSNIFDLTAGNISQCPWYAKYRAIEIVESSSLSSDLKEKAKSVLYAAVGNGIEWYAGTNSLLNYFEYSSDITKAKPGSLIVWDRQPVHKYGHVGIVEKVNSDGSLVISDGYNRFGGAYGSNSVNSIKIRTRTMSLDEVRTLGGIGKFVGYTYLLSHKK